VDPPSSSLNHVGASPRSSGEVSSNAEYVKRLRAVELERDRLTERLTAAVNQIRRNTAELVKQ